jgi:hypothetical protein
MSRRIAQTLLRTLRTSRLSSLPTAAPRQLLCKPRYQSPAVRYYATQGPRGVPIKEEECKGHILTPGEEERASLHAQAQY